ncbi:fungal-specific transcription factor domain-containing protein [Leptodontidium sp. 2 PMI_412]|nr:fungal-specific transcription factor domain-containing protein [Leptodontidium sp. 2 PMI_412]
MSTVTTATDGSARRGACERCQRRKVKCDRAQPSCAGCVKATTSCIYSSREPVLQSREIDQLRRRNRQLEAKSDALAAQIRDIQQGGADVRVGQDSYIASLPPSTSAPSGSIAAASNQQNEVINQVSYLSLNAGGERQFLGSGSGLLLASLVQTSLTTPNHEDSNKDVHAYPQNVGDSSSILSQIRIPSSQTLPPERQAKGLLSAYFAHDHLCYPFLRPRSVFDSLDAMYKDSTYHKNHPAEVFFIDMIFAIGTVQASKFDWQILPDSQTHQDRAMSRLPVVFARGGLPALQALLLVCQHRMVSSPYDHSASLWHLIGMAVRMSIELGLHRESCYTISTHSSSHALAQDLREEVEVKRRCFWCVVAMDRVVSLTLGRPLGIQLDEIDTELPHVQDLAIAMTFDGPLSPTQPFDNPPWQLRTSIFIHIVKYRIICGKALVILHGAKRPQGPAYADIGVIRDELAQELDDWHQETLLLSLPPEDINSTMPEHRSSFRSKEWYNLLYNNGNLILFRPSPWLSDVSHNSKILQKLFEAARQVITMYSYLHRSRKLNYSWITLQGVFLAGLSYIYALRCHFQALRQQPRSMNNEEQYEPIARLAVDPAVNEVLKDTRACSTVLVALSERWSKTRSCYQVFGRLSDAVVAEVVELRTQSTRHQSPHTSATSNLNGLATLQPELYEASQVQQGYMSSLTQTSIFQDCFDEFQYMYDDQLGSDDIMQLSQGWLSEIHNVDRAFQM